MKLKFLSIALFVFSMGYAQSIEYKILNAKLDENKKIILEIVLSNKTNENYVINKNFTFENKAPDFSSGSYTKVNIFKNDSVAIRIAEVKFETLTKRNKNIKKYDVFFIKSNTSETISFCLNDYLSEAEKIGLGMKMMLNSELSISLNFYQSGVLNIKKKKILAKIRKENYVIFRGQMNTNKVRLN